MKRARETSLPLPPGLAALVATAAAALLWLGPQLLPTVFFTAPGREAAPGSCDPSATSCLDLDSIIARARPLGSAVIRTRNAIYARGLENLPLAMAVPLDSISLVWLEAVDLWGNRSCHSDTLTLAPDVADVTPEPTVAGWRYYDIAGRRIPEPLERGIYFARGPGETRKRIVISARRRREATDGTAR